MKAERLTVQQVEEATGIAASAWSGNCYAIACAILRAKLVKGRPAYGHWTGPVHERSPFHRGGGLPFVRHGWIVLEERGAHAQRPGRVLDPTRWVFEHVAPYLYVGGPTVVDDTTPCEECGFTPMQHEPFDVAAATCSQFKPPVWPYDEGGDQLRAALQRPFPQVQPGEPVCVRLVLPTGVLRRLGVPGHLTRQQAAWVANLPYSVLGKDAWAVCTALDAAGCRAYLPIDTWTRADAERGL